MTIHNRCNWCFHPYSVLFIPSIALHSNTWFVLNDLIHYTQRILSVIQQNIVVACSTNFDNIFFLILSAKIQWTARETGCCMKAEKHSGQWKHWNDEEINSSLDSTLRGRLTWIYSVNVHYSIVVYRKTGHLNQKRKCLTFKAIFVWMLNKTTIRDAHFNLISFKKILCFCWSLMLWYKRGMERKQFDLAYIARLKDWTLDRTRLTIWK